MPIDPEATAKDYTLIIYNKNEINAQNSAESSRINSELDGKSDKAEEGSPSGIATLAPDGKHQLVQMPIANVSESQDPLNNTKIMTPQRVDEIIEGNGFITESEADSKYGNILSDGTVPMESFYLPQASFDIATVKFVQDTVSSNTTTYIRDTLIQMLAIDPTIIGDICFVTADGANNGEYLSVSNTTGGSVIGDWSKKSETIAWGTIVGDISDQTDVETRFSDIETKTDNITITQPVDLDQVELDTDTNTANALFTTEFILTNPDVLTSNGNFICTHVNLPFNMTQALIHVLTDPQTNKLWQFAEGVQVDPEGIGYRIQDTTIGTWTSWTKTNVLAQNSSSMIFQDLTGMEPSYINGQLFYSEGVLKFMGEFSDVTLNIGRELHMGVINNTGVLIPQGSVCRFDGLSGGIPQIALALADIFTNAEVLGVTTHDIPNSSTGILTKLGRVKMNTLGLPSGVPLYLSSTIAGGLTPTPPDIVSQVGGVLVVDAIDGQIEVLIQNNKAIPTILGLLQGQAGTGIYNVTAVAQPINDFFLEGSIVMGTDKVNGTISTPTEGLYNGTFTASMSFPTSVNTRTIYMEVFETVTVGVMFTLPFSIPRDTTETSTSFSAKFLVSAGSIYQIRIRSSVNMTITFQDIVTDMESVKI